MYKAIPNFYVVVLHKQWVDYKIKIRRKKTLLNNDTNWYIQIDGRDYEIIHGGEAKKIRLDKSRHTLSVYANDPNIGRVDEVLIPEGNDDYVFHAALSTALMGSAFKSCIKIKQL